MRTQTTPAHTLRPPARRQAVLSLAGVLILLLISALACTANDTLFIRLTETSTPTITPTPLALDTKFKIGDTVTVIGVSEFAAMTFAPLPGPSRAGIRGNVTCFPYSRVRIVDISKNPQDTNDQTIYYLIECTGKQGWAAERNLTLFNRQQNVTVKTADGKGAPMYRQPNAAGSALDTCPEGTQTRISALSVNTVVNTDNRMYVQIRCNNRSGFVLEETLMRN